MSDSTSPKVQPRKPVIPNGVVGMMIFLAAEVMFFAALISAYMILRAGVPVWPPWGQPRLPVWTTAINSVILVASGVFLYRAKKKFLAEDMAASKKMYLFSLSSGSFFVAFQGYEWVQLISFGLTITSSNYGGIFYLIIGLHALHAIAALFGLAWVYRRFDHVDRMEAKVDFTTIQLLWYFVVGLWPILYITVYLL